MEIQVLPKVVVYDTSTENEPRSEADILAQVRPLLVMYNHQVSAQSLISWQRKTQKCEKTGFGNLEFQLEIAPAPSRIAEGGGYGHGSAV